MENRGFDFISVVEADTSDGALATLKDLDADHPKQVIPSSDTKECPKCAEIIKAKATI